MGRAALSVVVHFNPVDKLKGATGLTGDLLPPGIRSANHMRLTNEWAIECGSGYAVRVLTIASSTSILEKEMEPSEWNEPILTCFQAWRNTA